MDRKHYLLEILVAQDDQGASHKVCGYEHLVKASVSAEFQQ